MKAKLAAALRKYFSQNQQFGLCNFLDLEDKRLLWLFKVYALKWPHAVKVMSDNGYGLCAYIIPASVNDKSVEAASLAYCRDLFAEEMTSNPLRRDLANFIVKEIARETKTKFVPISFDNSPPIK